MKSDARKFAFCFAMKLVDVVSDGVKDCFCENVVDTPSCKPPEMIILLQNPKGPFGLDTTVKTQNLAFFRGNALKGFLT